VHVGSAIAHDECIPAIGISRLASGIRHHLNSISQPAWTIRHLGSSISRLVYAISHRVYAISHPVTGISRLASGISCLFHICDDRCESPGVICFDQVDRSRFLALL
jgi:hypothetical protein